MARPITVTVLAVLANIVSGIHVPALDIRADSNCPASFTRCENTKLPSNFCCPSSTSCISLDSSSSAICCPSGSDCAFILPITCDIQALNATANPSSSLKTTRLTDSLPQCGNSCCPFGYTCQDGNACALIKDSSSEATSTIRSTASTAASIPVTATPKASSSSSTSTSTTASPVASSADATTTLSLVPSSAATASPGLSPDLNSTQVTQACPGFPAKAVAAGFFPGLISGALAAAIVTICLRRRHQKEDPNLTSLRHRSSGGTIINISDPIPSDEQSSFRTDFLLRKDSSRYPASTKSKSVLRRTRTRVKSLFGSNMSPDIGFLGPTPLPPIPVIPVTPPQQIRPQRQPSTESIKVYSPASMLASNNLLRPGAPIIQQDRPNTTFSEVMEKVGFKNKNGEPYFRVTETPAPQSRSPVRR